ncbi:TrbG/VirB9 family P-type conjugative transfer protein [Omnitrophica bacterium]|nr:TrbG/VirB9 family P-type conjugative transfer protein [Candidatus Omnitrophota bacterium]
MKAFISFAAVLMMFTAVIPASAATDEAAPANKTLKERQTFNKLRRSTRNIYKVTMRSSVAFRIQTALGYVSTIDLPEPALKVFAGDQELFKVEVYEKQVLIKPITDEPDARTNLIIVTPSGRLAFDVCVGPPQTADFVIDFRLPQTDELLVRNAFEKKVRSEVAQIEESFREKEQSLAQTAEKLSEEKLRERIASGLKTIELKASGSAGQVQVNLLSLSRMGQKAYLRFSILNYSSTAYKPLKVFAGAVEYERSLLRNRETGLIEFPSTFQLQAEVRPDSYVYGVLVFEDRMLGKNQKPVFRLMEDTAAGAGSRNIEIKGFRWFE